MTTKTRFFVISSLLVLFVGVGTGLVAYYAGSPGGPFARQGGMDDLQLVPGDAQLVAYADVRGVMASELRQKVRDVFPMTGDGQREVLDRTGINLETDIEQVIVSLAPSQGGRPAGALVLARGVFDTSRIEGLMRQQGAVVEEYKGERVIVTGSADAFAVSFIEPGLAVLGTRSLVRAAIDQKTGGPGVTANGELMGLVRSLDASDAWAVGRFDALASQARLPDGLALQLPAITWFAASAQVDSGIQGVIRADGRDQEAADSLREVVRGFMALAKLQSGVGGELKTFLDSLAIGGSGTTVTVGFHLPGALVDTLGSTFGSVGPAERRPLAPK